MFDSVSVTTDFAYMPWLANTALLKKHPNGLKFSKEKINILFCPNGAGKSSLLHAIAKRKLCCDVGYPTTNEREWGMRNLDKQWVKSSQDWWEKKEDYMPGITLHGDDNGSCFYFSQNFVPGGEFSLTHAMILGYSKEAKSLGKILDEKSSGQQTKGMFERFMAHVNDASHDQALAFEPYCKDSYFEQQERTIRELFKDHTPNRKVVLLDEPECSLDLSNQLDVWAAIAAIDLSAHQVIVATHSIYPLINPERFNFVTSDKKYLKEQIAKVAALYGRDDKPPDSVAKR